MSKREDYCLLLDTRNINDTLSEQDDLSYTNKLKIITSILVSYTPYTINKALNNYKLNYINKEVYETNINKLLNKLKYYCKKEQEK